MLCKYYKIKYLLFIYDIEYRARNNYGITRKSIQIKKN